MFSLQPKTQKPKLTFTAYKERFPGATLQDYFLRRGASFPLDTVVDKRAKPAPVLDIQSGESDEFFDCFAFCDAADASPPTCEIQSGWTPVIASVEETIDVSPEGRAIPSAPETSVSTGVAREIHFARSEEVLEDIVARDCAAGSVGSTRVWRHPFAFLAEDTPACSVQSVPAPEWEHPFAYLVEGEVQSKEIPRTTQQDFTFPASRIYAPVVVRTDAGSGRSSFVRPVHTLIPDVPEVAEALADPAPTAPPALERCSGARFSPDIPITMAPHSFVARVRAGVWVRGRFMWMTGFTMTRLSKHVWVTPAHCFEPGIAKRANQWQVLSGGQIFDLTITPQQCEWLCDDELVFFHIPSIFRGPCVAIGPSFGVPTHTQTISEQGNVAVSALIKPEWGPYQDPWLEANISICWFDTIRWGEQGRCGSPLYIDSLIGPKVVALHYLGTMNGTYAGGVPLTGSQIMYVNSVFKDRFTRGSGPIPYQ